MSKSLFEHIDSLDSFILKESASIPKDEVHTWEVVYNRGAIERRRVPNDRETIEGTSDDLMEFLDGEYVEGCYNDDDEYATLDEWKKNQEWADPSGSTIVLEIRCDGKLVFEDHSYDDEDYDDEDYDDDEEYEDDEEYDESEKLSETESKEELAKQVEKVLNGKKLLQTDDNKVLSVEDIVNDYLEFGDDFDNITSYIKDNLLDSRSNCKLIN